MNDQEMNTIMIANVSLSVEHLTDIELAALNNVAQLDMDPHGRIFDYEKVAGLFSKNGTGVHEETKTALAVVVNQRLADKNLINFPVNGLLQTYRSVN